MVSLLVTRSRQTGWLEEHDRKGSEGIEPRQSASAPNDLQRQVPRPLADREPLVVDWDEVDLRRKTAACRIS